MRCLFVSDIHGSIERYQKLAEAVLHHLPDIVLMGGDLLSNPLGSFNDLDDAARFVNNNVTGWIMHARDIIKKERGSNLRVFAILGNDDPRVFEEIFLEMDHDGIIDYVNCRTMELGDLQVSGYCFIPPSPFLLKDWEKYDVSRYVDPGSVSPEEGYRTVPKENRIIRYDTMEKDMEGLFSSTSHERTIFLFHSPPYKTALDRADLDGVFFDHVPLDPHVGSIAIRNFIEKHQPMISLHGHIHESTRLTGIWKEKMGRTWCFNAAHDGPELCIISFDTDCPENATRELL